MNRRNFMLGLGVLILGAIVLGFVYRALSAPPADRLMVAGDVRSVVRTISAPALSYPTVNYTVTVVSNAAPGDKTATLSETVYAGPQAAATTTRTQGIPVVSGQLTSVNVAVGDHVTTGAVLAQFDTAALKQGVTSAKLASDKTKAQVQVLKNGIQTILDNQDKIESGQAQLATGKAQLAAGKAQLAKAKAQLLSAKKGLLASQKQLLEAKRNRAQLEATLAALKKQAATFPPGQVPAALQKQIAQLQKLLGSIDPGLAAIASGLKKVNAGLAQVAAGEAKLAAASAQLASGAAQLATAKDALATAKKQAVRARDVVQIIAENADVPVMLAEAKVAQATVISPYSGFVTQAPYAGQVMIVGAPIVRIRADGPALVDTYLTPEQLSQLRLGQRADITYDSANGKVLHGVLAVIGSDAEYPPTSYPTDIVHMTRTVKATFRLDSGDQPPAGTPVDIAIHLD